MIKSTYDFLREKVQTVTPALAYDGGDYAAWKSVARETLADLLGMDKFEQVAPDTHIEYTQKIDGATEIRFDFESEAGYRVPCHLWLPDGVEKPPVIICLQGHAPGMHISLARLKDESEAWLIKDGDRDFCVRAVKEGFAAVALEQRNFGEVSITKNCMEPAMTNLLMGRTTIAERVWDVARLIDLLETEFADRVDAACISVMGNSGGGTTTAYVAALEDRIVMAVPSCAVCTYKDSIGAMAHCTCNYVPHIANVFDMDDLIAMAYPKYYIQVNGKLDKIFPIGPAQQVFEDGRAVYAAQGDEERIAMVVGEGGHRFYADDTWPIIHRMLGR